MSSQSQKHTIGLAGEFLVAGELLRRGIMAAVTYGNAKKADVIAVNGATAASIEVKSTSKPKWVLGGHLPSDTPDLWVLVHLPEDKLTPPEYFVVTSAELRALLLPGHEAYLAKYRAKHGKEYSGNGVFSIPRKWLNEDHLGAWGKIRDALGM